MEVYATLPGEIYKQMLDATANHRLQVHTRRMQSRNAGNHGPVPHSNTPPEQLGARVRVAMAWNGTTWHELAPVLERVGIGHSRATVDKLRSGAWFVGKDPDDNRRVLLALADACDVPAYFMLAGWPQPTDVGNHGLEVLRAAADELERQFRLLRGERG
jgi:hypothetical protein